MPLAWLRCSLGWRLLVSGALSWHRLGLLILSLNEHLVEHLALELLNAVFGESGWVAVDDILGIDDGVLVLAGADRVVLLNPRQLRSGKSKRLPLVAIVSLLSLHELQAVLDRHVENRFPEYHREVLLPEMLLLLEAIEVAVWILPKGRSIVLSSLSFFVISSFHFACAVSALVFGTVPAPGLDHGFLHDFVRHHLIELASIHCKELLFKELL